MNIVTKTTTPTKSIFTLLFIVFFSLLGVGNASAANEDKPYVVKKYNAANNYYDLVFYYNDEYNSVSNGEVIFIIDDNPTWINDGDKINSVYITNTFKSYKPKNCARWFKGVADIDGLYNLNTSECTSMEEMFLNCTASYIDISYFNTDKVTTMKNMFKGCSNIDYMSFSGLNTSNVTDMSGMFSGCTNLYDLYATNLNTAKVTDMSGMFEGCSSVHPGHIVDLLKSDKFTTQNVTNMSNMFKGCSSSSTFTKSLTLDYFTTDKVTDFSGMFEDCTFIDILDIHTFSSASAQDMSNMFKNCRNLKTIYVSSNWKPENLPENQQNMYAGCDKLPTDNPLNIYGEIYVTLNGTTLTFHYDSNKPAGSYAPNDADYYSKPEWYSNNPSVTKVEFLPEFQYAKPVSCAYWFQGCSELTEIEGINYLNVSDVVNLSYMFDGCKNLKIIDLRSFKTDQVQFMDYMFSGCESLTTILISDKWSTNGLGTTEPAPNEDWKRNKYSLLMFFKCYNLIGNDGTIADGKSVSKDDEYAIDYKGRYPFQYAHAGEGGYLTKDNFKVFNDTTKVKVYNPRTYSYELLNKWETYEGFTVTGNTITLPDAPPSDVIRHGDKFYCWTINNREITGNTTTYSEEDLSQGFIEVKAVYLHPYAEFDNATGTLTFKYDTKISHKKVEEDKNKHLIFDVIYYNGSGAVGNPGWVAFRKNEITTVTFDKSFKDYHLEEFVSSGDGTHYCGCNGWFKNCDKLTNVDFTYFDASQVTRMDYMFENCTSLTSVRLNINTKNVRNMEMMFYNCTSLTNVEFETPFSTENVQNMRAMFGQCTNLPSIDLKDFNTKKVSNFCGMFSECYALEELDLSSFETSDDSNISQIDITSMFSSLFATSNLERIIVSDKWKTDKLTNTTDVVFGGYLYNLVGGSGKKWNKNEVGIANANAKTGYLTKLPYTIEYKDAETDELLSEAITANLPSEIKGEKRITIKPPSRKGYVFKGWTDGLNGNTGLSATDPTDPEKDIEIEPTAKYNHVYVAHWEKLTIDVNLQSSDQLYYPIDSAAFCNNNESGLTLKFIADPDSPQPAHYTLTFNSDEIKQQGDVWPDANGEFTVFVDIPDYTLSDDYIGKIVFADDDEVSFSDPIEFTLTTNIPHKDVILYLYSNVIFVSNQSGRYNDASYQWFKDGNPVGEKRQYFTEPVISGSYGARINIAGQKPIYTCALVDNTVKVASSVVKVFPNPALAGKEFTVEIMNYTPGVEYKILVFSNNGAQVRSIATTEATTTLSLPRGIYNIALTANGNKCGAFKIIVEE